MNKILLILLPIFVLFQTCSVPCCPIGAQDNYGTMSDESPESNQRAQCDVSVDLKRTSVNDLGEYYHLETVIVVGNDDDAQSVELIVNLPVEIESSSFNGSVKTDHPKKKLNCNQCGHVIKCKPEKGSIGIGEEILFTAKIGKPRFPNVVPAIGVTALSYFPADPNPENNTFYWRAQ